MVGERVSGSGRTQEDFDRQRKQREQDHERAGRLLGT